nr:hypothetical protein [uncultured Blautia sp.]
MTQKDSVIERLRADAEQWNRRSSAQGALYAGPDIQKFDGWGAMPCSRM